MVARPSRTSGGVFLLQVQLSTAVLLAFAVIIRDAEEIWTRAAPWMTGRIEKIKHPVIPVGGAVAIGVTRLSRAFAVPPAKLNRGRRPDPHRGIPREISADIRFLRFGAAPCHD